jgi:hypothetical protein
MLRILTLTTVYDCYISLRTLAKKNKEKALSSPAKNDEKPFALSWSLQVWGQEIGSICQR